MSVQYRQAQLSRLMIPPSLNSQQPVSFDNQAMFSPSLPTSIQQGIHPPFLMGPANILQTPMQQVFMPTPPGAPGRPINHRVHASLAQLSTAGVRSSMGMPLTPLGQAQFPTVPFSPQMMIPGQQFPHRNRRAPSVSIGGPPRAVLGGPAAKARVASDSTAPPIQTTTPVKVKKFVVNLPKETAIAEDNQPRHREPWARTPLLLSDVQELVDPAPLETLTLSVYPTDQWRYTVPNTVDVFLPGMAAWDEYKQRIIDEKLERLGVERGFSSNTVSSDIPHIYAPHARAASISSPADPALLFFKLNKLQQSQNASVSNSASSSPPPPANFSPSPHLRLPNQVPALMRHGHSMSLVNTGIVSPSNYNPAAAFNPFGPHAILGSDEIHPRVAQSDCSTQSLPALSDSHKLGPAGGSRPVSRPDFIVGFGLNIPEEEEPGEEEQDHERDDVSDSDIAEDIELEEEMEEGILRRHQLNSRHRPRLSAALSLRVSPALSLRSVGRHVQDSMQFVPPIQSPPGNPAVDELDVAEKDTDAVGEWTGSEEFLHSDEESIGEWSNPSDEERARQHRRQRRMTRRERASVNQQADLPRKLPNFPRPPLTPHLTSSSQPDDDIMSNPSDEERVLQRHYYRTLSISSGQGRPLPPLPHSRDASTQFSFYDPALAHSRKGSSEQANSHTHTSADKSQSLTPSLNPLAKPFVFGTSQPSPWVPIMVNAPALPRPQLTGHSRTLSLGRPLNAAASEFKPTGFKLGPPAIAPQMSFTPPAPDSSAPSVVGRPLPVPPSQSVLAREMQGREKRQRRGSSASLDGEELKDNMNVFRFPVSDISKTTHRSAPPTPAAFETERRNSLGAPPQHLTVDGFLSDVPLHKSTEAINLGRANTIPSIGARELPTPPQPKSKRAPIPLDFKHPVSTNTVPAGLFKALVGGEGDERSRKPVRSRLNSRDFFEHSPRPSLDDLNVPTISKKISRARLAMDSGERESSAERAETVSPPSRRRRRSSLPAFHSGSSFSDMSIVPTSLSRRKDMRQLEQRLETLLDEKLRILHQDIIGRQMVPSSALNEDMESKISEVVSLFRAQLQESAARGLDDSQMDARGEMDFELIKDIIDQANKDSRAIIQRDMAEVLRRVEIQSRSLNARNDPAPFVEEITSRTIKAVVGLIQQLAARMEELSSPISMVHELMSMMEPHLISLRPESIDYDHLTIQLSQAVKPNISQLIDLASDKRETAGLILERLLPALQKLAPDFNAEDMIATIVAEVGKIVRQVDVHEIKEHVSDLVVERLDSRLANRDRLDGLAEKVKEAVAVGLGPMPGEIGSIFGKLATIHRDISELNPEDLSSLRHDVVSIISDLPSKLGAATEAMNAALIDLRLQSTIRNDQEPDETLAKLECVLNNLANDQKGVLAQTQEIISLHQDVIRHLSALPASLVEATNGLQDSQADLVSRIQLSQKDAEELRRLSASNSELQVQLSKARGAHGQVRVEKDLLAEKLAVMETEKDQLRDQYEELKVSMAEKSAEAVATEARNSELEEALTEALARLQSADASAQTYLERIADLEKTNREQSAEKQELQSKVHSFHLEATLAVRDRESAQEKCSALQKQLDQIASQQDNWDKMHRAAEQIGLLTSLVEQADNEELRELRRDRDRTKTLEGEFTALQRRFKDQENKMVNNDRTMANLRQSLAPLQQQAAEWEKRATEQEAETRSTRVKLDEAEQARTELDAELSLIKSQVQEKEVDERNANDRESKLRDQVALLEEQLARVRGEADRPKSKITASSSPSHANGTTTNSSPFTPPPRPDSRASTVYGPSRSTTPTSNQKQSRTSSGVWNSMHNPYNKQGQVPATPKARYASPYRGPSPSPSIVSNAPTVDADGWWS